MNGTIIFIAIIFCVVLIAGIATLLAHPKSLRLKHLRGALRVAKYDSKDPATGVYWADVFASQVGIPNLVRNDIQIEKPALSATATRAEAKAKTLREKGRKVAKAIHDRSAIAVSRILAAAEARAGKKTEAGKRKAAMKEKLAISKARAQEMMASEAKNVLAEIAEVEAIITKASRS